MVQGDLCLTITAASHVDPFHTASADFKAKVKDWFVICHRSTVLLRGYWFHRGAENFVPPPPPSEGIHEIGPSWYLS